MRFSAVVRWRESLEVSHWREDLAGITEHPESRPVVFTHPHPEER